VELHWRRTLVLYIFLVHCFRVWCQNNRPQPEEGRGQPQGIAPTIDPTDSDIRTVSDIPTNSDTPLIGRGQPQGITPTIDPTIAPTTTTKNKTIGDMMDAFKSITTVEYIRGVKNFGWQTFNGKLLQWNYYEHIIRNEQSYQNISDYIKNNPAKWGDDKFHKS
jgi:hypothetical protein